MEVDALAQVVLALRDLDAFLEAFEDLSVGVVEQTRDFRRMLKMLDAALAPSETEVRSEEH